MSSFVYLFLFSLCRQQKNRGQDNATKYHPVPISFTAYLVRFSYSELFIKVTLNNRKAWKQAIFPKFVFSLPDLFYVFVIDIFPNICYVKYIQITHNRHKM